MALQKFYKDFETGQAEPAVGKLAELLEEVVPEHSELQDSEPDGTVTGRYASISVDQYIHFFSCDVTFELDNDTQGMVPAGLWVGALYLSDHETVFGNRLVRFPGNGVPTVLTFGEPAKHTERYRANRPIRMSSYLVAKEFFEQSQTLSGDSPIAAVADLITPGVNQHALAKPERIAETLTSLLNNPYQGHMARLFVESTVTASVFELAQSLNDAQEEQRLSGPHKSTLAIEARHVIDTEPEQFGSIITLASRLGTNETTLQREFKAETGQTIFQYVMHRRMQAARILIRDRKLAISQVAYKVGYNNPANFSTAYKRFYGHSPAEERA